MPRGFIGRPARAYLTEAAEAHNQAVTRTTQAISRAQRRNINARTLPFQPSDGAGAALTGVGNSSNIVVSQQEYETIAHDICRADEDMGACLYNAACEIEKLCQTAFILPTAVPRCLNVSDTVKRSLGQFRTVTEEMALQSRRFAREITEVGP